MRAHLVAGPPEHGVTRFALEVGAQPALAAEPVVRVPDAVGADLAAAVRDQAPGATSVHVNVTDRLFGANAPAAADVLVALAHRVPTTVTLHDVPQPSDGPGGYPRRAAAYARVVAAARGVVVSSDHERLLLVDALRDAGRPDLADAVPLAVIPLPVEQPAPFVPSAPARPRDVVLLGFLYPGKGHEEALAALADLPPDVGLLALGRPSPGHDDLVDSLAAQAGSMGRRFAVSGYVPDDELDAALRRAAVPVAPHRHLSASGSIGSWLSAGRRPLVPRSRYVEELAARCPGALWVYDDEPGALGAAVAQALADPDRTWLAPDVRLHPGRAEVADRYVQVLDGWLDDGILA